MKIPFNKPSLTGNELKYIQEVAQCGKLSGDGIFTKKCHSFFEVKFGFKKVFLTSSCTDALEMSALLLNIRPGDEVIMPSFTFVSTANAFVLRGANIVFADSEEKTPNINIEEIERLITPKTKAVVVVHYAGISCDMDPLLNLAKKHNLFIIEDAAHAIDSYYKEKHLGSFGNLAAFSFHETKNIFCGEGGMLIINDINFIERAEIIREKGTNRSAFSRGEVDKYQWIDIGSSFLPSDIMAAFLFAQLENIEKIQNKRKLLWENYYKALKPLQDKGISRLPFIPDYAVHNGHLFYIICNNFEERQRLIEYLLKHEILSLFHYLPLHKSPYFKSKHDGRDLPNADMYSKCILRLPIYYALSIDEVMFIANKVTEFYNC